MKLLDLLGLAGYRRQLALSCSVITELPPIVASRAAKRHVTRLELAGMPSVLQAASARENCNRALQEVAQTGSTLLQGCAVNATIDRPHELGERRPIFRILGRRVADQGDEEGPVAARRAVRDVGEQPRSMSNVPYMCFFGKKRTRAPDALPARLGRAAGPRLAGARAAAAVVVLRRRTVVVRLTRCTLRIQELLQRALAELLAPGAASVQSEMTFFVKCKLEASRGVVSRASFSVIDPYRPPRIDSPLSTRADCVKFLVS